MPCYDNSIHALQHLLQSGGHNEQECHKKNTKTVNCQITKTSQHVYHLRNGIEYCFVEVTCDDCTQYGLQAYGEEAMKLYNEISAANWSQSTMKVFYHLAQSLWRSLALLFDSQASKSRKTAQIRAAQKTTPAPTLRMASTGTSTTTRRHSHDCSSG